MTVTYTTAADVSALLQLGYSFGTTTNPTQAIVEGWINESEDDIDFETQHGWRAKTVTDEFYDIPWVRVDGDYAGQGVGIAIFLRHKNIKALSNASGDKIEVWTGSTYEDWITAKTEGRANDFWVDYERGVLYLRYFWAFYRNKALRLTYRYGESTVPGDIKECCTKMAAIRCLQNEDRSANLAETGDPTRLNYDQRISQWRADIHRIIRKRAYVAVI